MIAYPDTSFLCAMYRQQENSGCAAQHFANMPEPLYVASPLLFEFRQAQACSCLTHPHLFRQGGQGFGEHLNSLLNVHGFGVHEGKSKAFTIRCGIEFAKAAEFLIGEMKQADCS